MHSMPQAVEAWLMDLTIWMFMFSLSCMADLVVSVVSVVTKMSMVSWTRFFHTISPP